MLSRARLGLFAAFAGLGGTAATVPALMPALEQRLGAEVLTAVPVLFAGLLLGVLASAPLLARMRAAIVVVIGAALQAVGLVALTVASSVPTVLAVVACTGIGFGLTEAAGSVTAKRTTRGSTTRLLAALMGAVAVAAAITPLGIAFTPGGTWLVPILVATLQLVACASLLRAQDPAAVRLTADGRLPSEPGESKHLDRASARRVFAVAGVALVLYVGVETVFSGWSAVIPARVLDIDPQTAALGTSAFWLCMATGRFLATTLLHRGMGATTLLIVCMVVAATALLLSVPVAGSPLILAGLGVAVVAMAPVYSIVLGEALDRLPPELAGRATGPLVACGALGGTLLPAALVLAGLDPASPATAIAAAAVCLIIAAGALAQSRSTRTPMLQHQESTSP